jgi:predicted nucleic acid-binding protein
VKVVTAPPLPEQVCEDPDDDKFLACALAGRNKVIVSGDKHMLDVSGYQKIEVLKPRKFVITAFSLPAPAAVLAVWELP